LKHLERTRLLLHIVDANPDRGPAEIAAEVATIEAEVEQYSEQLKRQPRWLVLNKLDLLPADERDAYVTSLVERIGWSGPAFGISALTRQGTEALARDVMRYLEQLREADKHAADQDVAHAETKGDEALRSDQEMPEG
jgi:GTPase